MIATNYQLLSMKPSHAVYVLLSGRDSATEKQLFTPRTSNFGPMPEDGNKKLWARCSPPIEHKSSPLSLQLTPLIPSG